MNQQDESEVTLTNWTVADEDGWINIDRYQAIIIDGHKLKLDHYEQTQLGDGSVTMTFSVADEHAEDCPACNRGE